MIVSKQVRNGSPELVIDGKRPSPGFGRLQQPNYWAKEKLDQFLRPDYDLFFTQIGELETLGWCWDGRDGYDFAQYEHHIRGIVEKKPDARLILFVGGRTPYLWQRDHAEDLVVREDGTRTNAGSTNDPNYVNDTAEAIRRLVTYFESGPLADHIAGYNPILHGNEWLVRSFHADYAPGAVARFRAWLEKAYGGDVEALRRNWKQPEVTFETAAVPTGADFAAHGLTGQFDRHEQYGTHCRDYLRFFNEGVANMARAHARAVKEASEGRKLVSIMFGYTYSYGVQNLANSGHAEMVRLLESPDIDLVHCPYDYYNRCAGGVHYSQISTDSVTAHGKVFATQIDSKLYHHDFDRPNARTPWESVQLLKRDVSFALMRNAYHYYYEMCTPCWRGLTGNVEWRALDFSGDVIQDAMVRLRDIANANDEELPASATEVALFHSRASAYDRAYHPTYGFLYLQGMRNYFLAYGATPFHDYFVEDFDLVERDFKVYIFPDATSLTPAQRQRIRARLERIGATALWFYAPGYVSEGGSSVEHIEALTGIRVKKRADLRDYAHLDIDRFNHPLTRGLEQRADFGSDLRYEFFQEKQEWLGWQLKTRDDYKLSPLFTVNDPDAECLATLRGAREPGLAIKQVGGMTSVYSAAPCPSPEFFQNLFRHAGAHVYSDAQDIVYANARYVTLCANGDGRKTLRLPRKVDLYDAYENKLLAKHTDAYSFDAKHAQVEIFRLG